MKTMWRIVAGVSAVALAGVAPAVAADGPLIDAVKAGDAAAARTLLADGASVGTAEVDGTTALHWAVHHDRLDIASLLLAARRRGRRDEPLRCDAARARLRERQHGDDRAAARSRGRPQPAEPGRRDAADDGGPHRQRRVHRDAAGAWRRGGRGGGVARTDGPDVGDGPEPGGRGGRAARRRRRSEPPLGARLHAGAVRGARGARRRARGPRSRRRRRGTTRCRPTA